MAVRGELGEEMKRRSVWVVEIKSAQTYWKGYSVHWSYDAALHAIPKRKVLKSSRSSISYRVVRYDASK
jgi:hypothetical protein